MSTTNRTLIKDWDSYRINLLKETSIISENEIEKKARIKQLLNEPEMFFKYYFPNYCYSEPADFHKQATKRMLKNKTWYEVRAWSRELAKSSRAMMEDFYMIFTGEIKNILLISATSDSACNLLKPYKINLEANQRIINDFGEQKGLYTWEDGFIKTRHGVQLMAVGAGQSPRGTRNEEIRPDKINFDDIDTDEEVRNPKRIKDKWNWIEQAVMPTVSVSKSKRFLFLGNIIGKDTCITRAIEKADHSSIINIRDKNGKSTWASKNSEENIDWLLSKMSFASAQKEYFNNPVTEGSVFKQMRWDVVPELSKFKFLVCYGDPATSNKENKANCYKANILLGMHEGKLYVINAFLQQAKNSTFIGSYFDMHAYVNGKTTIYHYIENNSLQDPFYEQVFQPLINEQCKLRAINVLPMGDDRKKPDKFSRIEGNLEPLNRLGKLIFNIKEKSNPHMVQLEEQFKAVEPQLSAPVDGPDAVEGGYWIIQNKLSVTREIKTCNYKKSTNKY